MRRIVPQRKVAMQLLEGKAKPTDEPVAPIKIGMMRGRIFDSLRCKMNFSQSDSGVLTPG